MDSDLLARQNMIVVEKTWWIILFVQYMVLNTPKSDVNWV